MTDDARKRTGLLAAQGRVFMSDLTTNEKMVLLAILDRWSRSSPTPYPGINAIAKDTSMHRGRVMRTIESLAAKGAVSISAGRRGVNTYTLSPAFDPLVAECDRSQGATSPTAQPALVANRDQLQDATGSESQPALVANRDGYRLQDATGTGCTAQPEGIQRREQLKEPTEGSKGRAPAKARSRLSVALADPRVHEIAEHYRITFRPSASWKLEGKHNGKSRAVAVLEALETDRSVDYVKRAINGCAASSWHVETHNTDLELIVRADKIERFAEAKASTMSQAKSGPAEVPTDRSTYARAQGL